MSRNPPLERLLVVAGIFFSLISIYAASDPFFVSAATEPTVLRGHAGSVSSIDVSPDGRLIASASLDRTIRLWDAASGKTIRVLNKHADEIYAVSFSPDGKMLASSDYGGKILIWSVKSDKPLRTLQMKSWSIAVAFSPDNNQLAVGSQDRNITIYDAQTGSVVRTLETKYAVNALAFSPDNRRLAGGSLTIAIWNLETGQIHKLLQGHQGRLTAVAFSKDSRFLASASSDKTARVWNAETGETVKTFQTETPIGSGDSAQPYKWKMPVTDVAFSPDGKTLAAATGRAIHMWEISTGKNYKTLEGHERSVTSVRFSPDGKFLVSGSLDNTARIWSLQ